MNSFVADWCCLMHEAVKAEDVTVEASEAVAEAVMKNIELLKPTSDSGKTLICFSV